WVRADVRGVGAGRAHGVSGTAWAFGATGGGSGCDGGALGAGVGARNVCRGTERGVVGNDPRGPAAERPGLAVRLVAEQARYLWWAFSLGLVLALSLYPQSHQPHLSTRIAINSPSNSSADFLRVAVTALHNAPLGCTRKQTHLRLFAANQQILYRQSGSENLSGEKSYLAASAASLPHHTFFQLAPTDNSDEKSFLLSTHFDSAILKVGIHCDYFPANLIFGKELYLIDLSQREILKVMSPTALAPPKTRLLPFIVLKLLNPFMWPSLLLWTIKTYTTIIELGLVWPMLTVVLKKIFLNYRRERVATGKMVVDLNVGKVKTAVILAGVQEVFAALVALFADSFVHPLKKKEKLSVSSKQHSAATTITTTTTVATSKRESTDSLLKPPSPSTIATDSDATITEEIPFPSPAIPQITHARASSSPVRMSTAQSANSTYAIPTIIQTRPTIKKSDIQTLWSRPPATTTSSRIVGSLLSTINRAAGGGRRRRWEIPGYVFIVIKAYDPVFKDELAIRIGDVIRIKKIFDDGWCVGVNQQTNVQGILPMAFLTCINPTSPSAPPVDPQQFIPRETTTLVSATSSNVGGGGDNSGYAGLSSIDLFEEVPLPEEFSDLPPSHLRKRNRSLGKTPSTVTVVTAQVFETPQLSRTSSASGPNIATATAAVSITAAAPRARSSSMQRTGGRRNRSQSVKSSSWIQKAPSNLSLKIGGNERAQIAADASIVRKQLEQQQQQQQQKRGRSGRAESVKSVRSVGSIATEGEDEKFEDTVLEINGGSGVKADELDDIEEVVVIEEDGDAEGSGEGSSGSEDDMDVWPRGLTGAASTHHRNSKVSLGGYSRIG
ncbi:hypothetical protein HK100_005346, partial [Physocladia obscura]